MLPKEYDPYADHVVDESGIGYIDPPLVPYRYLSPVKRLSYFERLRQQTPIHDVFTSSETYRHKRDAGTQTYLPEVAESSTQTDTVRTEVPSIPNGFPHNSNATAAAATVAARRSASEDARNAKRPGSGSSTGSGKALGRLNSQPSSSSVPLRNPSGKQYTPPGPPAMSMGSSKARQILDPDYASNLNVNNSTTNVGSARASSVDNRDLHRPGAPGGSVPGGNAASLAAMRTQFSRQFTKRPEKQTPPSSTRTASDTSDSSMPGKRTGSGFDRRIPTTTQKPSSQQRTGAAPSRVYARDASQHYREGTNGKVDTRKPQGYVPFSKRAGSR